RESDPRDASSDRAAFASNHLDHAANYLARPSVLHEGVYLNVAAVYPRIKEHEMYGARQRTVSTAGRRQLAQAGRAPAWRAWTPGKQPQRRSWDGPVARATQPSNRAALGCSLADLQASSLTGLRCGEVLPSQLGLRVRTQHTTVPPARRVPRQGYDVLAVVDVLDVDVVVEEREPVPAPGTPALCAGRASGTARESERDAERARTTLAGRRP